MQVAIDQALVILSWFENLTKEERPPEYIWEDSEGLEMWWATVEERREHMYGGARSGSPADDGPEPAAEMAENDLARALKRG